MGGVPPKAPNDALSAAALAAANGGASPPADWLGAANAVAAAAVAAAATAVTLADGSNGTVLKTFVRHIIDTSTSDKFESLEPQALGGPSEMCG
jgi:hypothetical protein